MGYTDKQPPRMQGQFYSLKSGGMGTNFRLESENFPSFFFAGGCPEIMMKLDVIYDEIVVMIDERNDAIDNEHIEEVDSVQIGDTVVDRVGFKDVENALVTLDLKVGTKEHLWNS